jgi:peptide/nickel transport system ATP-binding protein
VPIDGRPPSLITRPSGCAFHPRCPFAREAHKRVDPVLEPVEGASQHDVACLLPAPVRTELWKRLAAGEVPERARAAVPMGDSAEGAWTPRKRTPRPPAGTAMP